MSELINRETGEMFEIIKANDDGLYVTQDAIDIIVSYETAMKKIKDEYDEYKKALMEAMKAWGVEKIKTDYFTASYRAPSERISLDTKKVEKKYPKVYDDCLKVSDVSESVSVRMAKKK